MPRLCSRITLSRFFDNNVKLVANMCPRCYEESADVKVISVNLIFLRQTIVNFKDLNLKDYDFLNFDSCPVIDVEATQKDEYGFTQDEIRTSLECTETLNKVIKTKGERIRKLEEDKKVLCLSDDDNNNIMCFKGFSTATINESRGDHKKGIKACEKIRYSIYSKVSARILNNTSKTHSQKLGRIITEKEKYTGSQKMWKKRRHKLKENESKYFTVTEDPADKASIKREYPKIEVGVKPERCGNVKDGSGVCSEQCANVIKAESEIIDYEEEYFRALKTNRFLFKAENHIKMESRVALKKEELEDEPTEEKIPTVRWIPPRSPHNLIEECLYHDPWALLVATIFLNRTSCMNARPYVFWFLKENSDPFTVLDKYPEELEKYFVNLGLQKTRAVQVWRMSHDFVYKNWKSVRELYGIGTYGENAFKMFCLGDFSVEPKDRFLKIYKAWYQKIAAKQELM